MKDRIFKWIEIAETVSKFQDVKRCMITLTYDTSGTIVKASDYNPLHISTYIHALKRRSGLQVLGYAWVMELQQKGTPHYHILLLYRGRVPYPDKSGMWKHGMSNIKFKIRTLYYIAKYVGKEYQKDLENFPKGARLFAVAFRVAEHREALKINSLSAEERRAYDLGGWELVREMRVRPQWAKSVYLGSAVTLDYSDYLVTEYSKNLDSLSDLS